MNEKRGKGFWILIVTAAVLTVWYLLGQTVAVFNYDLTVAWGLQDERSKVTDVGVAFGQGFGLADSIAYIPLLVLGIVGLLRRKAYGMYAMFGAQAITVYWPIVCLSAVYFAKGAEGWALTAYMEYSIVLPIITAYGVWSLIYLYSNRNRLISQ